MLRCEICIAFSGGLHARPASRLMEICSAYDARICFIKGDLTVNPKSVLNLMAMEAGMGTRLMLEVSGKEETAAMGALQAFFSGDGSRR